MVAVLLKDYYLQEELTVGDFMTADNGTLLFSNVTTVTGIK